MWADVFLGEYVGLVVGREKGSGGKGLCDVLMEGCLWILIDVVCFRGSVISFFLANDGLSRHVHAFAKKCFNVMSPQTSIAYTVAPSNPKWHTRCKAIKPATRIQNPEKRNKQNAPSCVQQAIPHACSERS